jgi:cation diffusion facilitator family transporter
MGHNHHHLKEPTGKILLWSIAINLLIPVLQIVGGMLAQSMALISDAMHNFSDCTGLLIAYFAYRFSQKRPSPKYSFGFRRAEIFAAVINASLIFGASFFILWKAFGRLKNPEPVSGILVIVMALVGVFGNGLTVLLLSKGAKENINIRGAFVHMLGDMLISVVVLISGVFILFKPWYWIDPLLSVGIVLFILKTSWSLLKEAVHILMEGVPHNLELKAIQDTLEQIPGVLSAHHLHVWTVGPKLLAFTGHIQVQDQELSRLTPLKEKIKIILKEKFSIDHAVIEFGHQPCNPKDLLCPIHRDKRAT